MKLKTGSGKNISFIASVIEREASQESDSGIVTAQCDNGSVVTISQHNSGDWDVAVNDNPEAEFPSDEGKQAVALFISLCQQNNS